MTRRADRRKARREASDRLAIDAVEKFGGMFRRTVWKRRRENR